MKWISELINTKGTKDALIIGSGASLDYLPYSHISNVFSKWAYVIVVNELAFDEHIKYDFAISHHTDRYSNSGYFQRLTKHIQENPFKHVLSEYDSNNPSHPKTIIEGDFYMFKGLNAMTTKVLVKHIINPEKDYIFVGGSILFDAIGLGLHLGVNNFYLMGFDGGDFQGKGNYKMYLDIYGEQYSDFSLSHSVRTMNSFKSLQEWIRPRGVNFTHISARYGSSDTIHTDWNSPFYAIVE